MEREGRGLLLRGGEGGRDGRISPYQSTFASGAHAVHAGPAGVELMTVQCTSY